MVARREAPWYTSGGTMESLPRAMTCFGSHRWRAFVNASPVSARLSLSHFWREVAPLASCKVMASLPSIRTAACVGAIASKACGGKNLWERGRGTRVKLHVLPLPPAPSQEVNHRSAAGAVCQARHRGGSRRPHLLRGSHDRSAGSRLSTFQAGPWHELQGVGAWRKEHIVTFLCFDQHRISLRQGFRVDV